MTLWDNRYPLDDEAITNEERRLGNLLDQVDRLADDPAAQEALLQSLSMADRQEITSALVYANALRMVGRQLVPHMTGAARERLHAAMRQSRRSADGDMAPVDLKTPMSESKARGPGRNPSRAD